MTRLLLDCDPGLDDAVALALAMASPELELLAVSTVAANAPIDVVTRNAEQVMDRLGCRCPLFQGAARPLAIEARHSTDLWGGDGRLPLGAPAQPARRILREGFHELARDADVVCAIGSLTNIAGLIKSGHRPRKLVVMGGALGRGNATPQAELNIWADPHAARIVFASGIPITLVPLDITRGLIVPAGMIARLNSAGTPAARLVGELLPHAGRNAQPSAIHDAAVIAYLLWPALFTADPGRITVVTEGDESGRTLFATASDGPHHVLTQVVRDDLFRHMQRLLCGEKDE
ncbi:MAG: nucleoside hydrolase [Parvibaculaceae bacterium]